MMVYLITNDMSGRTEHMVFRSESDARRFARSIYPSEQMDFVSVVPVVVSPLEATS